MLKDLGPPICNITLRPKTILVTIWNVLLHLVDLLSEPNQKTFTQALFLGTKTPKMA